MALQALANARRLHADAVTLRNADRLPSAFMVAGLAADELGKHILASSFFARDQTDEEWRKFWRRCRRHEEKLGDALLSAWTGDLLNDLPVPDAAAFHLERLQATYVDVSDDGAVISPVEAVVSQRVDDVLDLLQNELSFCESVTAQMTPSQFAAFLESIRNSGPDMDLRKLYGEKGPEAAVAFVIAARAGMSRDQALSFARAAETTFGRLSRGNR